MSFDVTNVGLVSGAETPQLYIVFPAPHSADEPALQLRNFTKVTLAPGETATLTLTLSDTALSVWDVDQHAWSLVSGVFNVIVAASVADLRLRGYMSV